MKQFTCNTCGLIDVILVDGYNAGDTLLEGVMFEVRYTKNSIKVTPDGQALAYFDAKGISKTKWCKRVKESFLDEIDSGEAIGTCAKCNGDVIIITDVEPSPIIPQQVKLLTIFDLFNDALKEK